MTDSHKRTTRDTQARISHHLRVAMVVAGTAVLSYGGGWALWSRHLAAVHRANWQLIQAVPFLELDARLGWRNKRDFAGYFPSGVEPPGRAARPVEPAMYQTAADRSRIAPSSDEAPRQDPEHLVWVVGDSSSFGLGVEGEHVFAERLRRAVFHEDVDVKNWSVVGYGSGQVKQLVQAKLEAGPATPDVIVVWAGFNDAQFSREFGPFRGTSLSLHHWRYVWNVSRLIDRCRREGIKVVLATFPCLEPFGELDRVNAWIRAQRGRSAEVAVIDVQRAFAASHERNLYASLDDRLPYHFHPSREGHAIVHRLLLPVIQRLRENGDGLKTGGVLHRINSAALDTSEL